jgi:hypothetical protein
LPVRSLIFNSFPDFFKVTAASSLASFLSSIIAIYAFTFSTSFKCCVYGSLPTIDENDCCFTNSAAHDVGAAAFMFKDFRTRFTDFIADPVDDFFFMPSWNHDVGGFGSD